MPKLFYIAGGLLLVIAVLVGVAPPSIAPDRVMTLALAVAAAVAGLGLIGLGRNLALLATIASALAEQSRSSRDVRRPGREDPAVAPLRPVAVPDRPAPDRREPRLIRRPEMADQSAAERRTTS